MTQDELISFYSDKKEAGMDFSEIRKELENKNIENEVVKVIIYEIDNNLQTKLVIIKKHKKANQAYIMSIIILGLTLIFYFFVYIKGGTPSLMLHIILIFEFLTIYRTKIKLQKIKFDMKRENL
jgi:uncharacterized membrane protein